MQIGLNLGFSVPIGDQLKQGAAGGAEGDSMIGQTLREAVAHHQAGRLEEAEGLYRSVLKVAPNHPDASNLMGLVAHQQGRHDEAIVRIRAALQANDQVAAYHNNMGAAQRSVGLLGKAEASFLRAVELNPHNESAWSNLLAVLMSQGKQSRIAHVIDTWVHESPHSKAAREARAAHRLEVGNVAGAIDDHCHLAALNTDDPAPSLQVGLLAHQQGDDASALAAFLDARDRDTRRFESTMVTVQTKLQHDIQQLQWLIDDGNTSQDWALIRARYERAYERIYGGEATVLATKSLDPLSLAELGEWYGQPVQVEPCPALLGSALSLDCDPKGAESRYLNSHPGVTILDGLLTSGALEQLRRFCLGSTIWNEFRYNGGYVGTKLAQGFANGLLLQIARELRASMPGVLGPHPLRQMWAFKYDQRRSGIGVHADQAAVNVNFWITPDEANLDPETGGLVVWRKCAPLDWDFNEFNRTPERLVSWVNETGAERLRIPYRCNRAALFDSNLVHSTDEFQFAPGYENRRINITMLFGDRSG